MPEILVHLVSGRPAAQKKAVMRAITEAVVTHLEVPADRVVVQIVESTPESKARGGVPFAEQ